MRAPVTIAAIAFACQPAPAASAPGAVPGSLPRIEIERPYRLWERPRDKGEVYAAGRDEELARWNVGGTKDPGFISNRPSYHPGARVRVDAEAIGIRLPQSAVRDPQSGRSKSVLTSPRLQAELRKYGYWPYRLCFEDGLRKDQTLEGETIVRADVDAGGRIVAARVLATKLTVPGVAECLAKKTEQLSVPAPGRPLRVRLDIELWPGDAPVPSIGPPEGAVVDNPGRLSAEAIENAAATVTGDVAACYAAGLERDAGLWGRIELRVDLDERGGTRRIAENESRFPDREVVRCAVAALEQVRFPAPKSGPLALIYAVRVGQPPSAATSAHAEAAPNISPSK